MFLLTILGLALFESVSSVDNAIINAEVLAHMSQRARRWFLLWGFLLAVVLVRGLLPWAIVWATVPSLGPIGALTAAFSSNPQVAAAIEQAAPQLLLGGATFLIMLFVRWLLGEPKAYAFAFERRLAKAGWQIPAFLVALSLVAYASSVSSGLAYAAATGALAFLILHGIRSFAERKEADLTGPHLSDNGKLLYLEVIDAVFSIDGVLGAFAFTLSVPLILLGNGLGALVVRQLTMANASRIKRYPYLKNGAMYSVFLLGLIMMVDAFGAHIPEYLSPVATFAIVGYFFLKKAPARG